MDRHFLLNIILSSIDSTLTAQETKIKRERERDWEIHLNFEGFLFKSVFSSKRPKCGLQNH